MPKPPKNEKRDVVSNAVHIMQIATGQVETTSGANVDSKLSDGESAAATLGRLGGKARAKNLSARKRKAIARNAAESRWKKRKSKK